MWEILGYENFNRALYEQVKLGYKSQLKDLRMVLTYSTDPVSYHVGRIEYIPESGLWVSFAIGSRLNRTPSEDILFGRTSRRFLWCWLLLLFSSLGVFTFLDYFSLPPALHPGFSAREGLHQIWALPWLLSVALLLSDFSVIVLPRALRFWVGIF